MSPPRKDPADDPPAPSPAGSLDPVVISLDKREKRAVSVARAILRDVRDAGLVAGDRLPSEATMLGRYQVARNTLREALRILEVQGLISIKFGRDGGPIVRDPTPRDFSHVLTLFLQGMDVTLEHIFDARRVVEPVMARLAAGCRDRAKQRELHDILLRTEEAVEWEVFATATADFHRRVLTMSGNPILDLWAATLQQSVDYREGPPLPRATFEAIRREHLAIGRAILDHDGDGASRLMVDHMKLIGTRSRHDRETLRQRIEWR